MTTTSPHAEVISTRSIIGRTWVVVISTTSIHRSTGSTTDD
ncbi:MAG: hypothetical protein ACRDPS_04805 [Nocardioides sp.]